MVVSFHINQQYIVKNICENRYRPQVQCKGNCLLMKKFRQEEQKEQEAPGTLKLETPSIVLSSKCFFATIQAAVIDKRNLYFTKTSSGKPVDQPADFFHPPSV